ncbi:hypothetical protein C8Q69DRAFT_397127, partial [Paecilomyces variotii]
LANTNIAPYTRSAAVLYYLTKYITKKKQNISFFNNFLDKIILTLNIVNPLLLTVIKLINRTIIK